MTLALRLLLGFTVLGIAGAIALCGRTNPNCETAAPIIDSSGNLDLSAWRYMDRECLYVENNPRQRIREHLLNRKWTGKSLLSALRALGPPDLVESKEYDFGGFKHKPDTEILVVYRTKVESDGMTSLITFEFGRDSLCSGVYAEN